MKTALSFLLLATAGLAGPAAAQDIRISIAGKSPAAVEADINHAAAEVCTSAVRQGDIGFFEMNLCVRTVSAQSLQQARAALKPA